VSGPGLLISIEGADGVGKTTQARLLAQRIRGLGREVVETREPGGSPGAERIRALILEGDVDRWSPTTEMLLFCAARRDHCERVVFPALDRGAAVISDRFHDSTAVYQAAAHRSEETLFQLLHEATVGRKPDRTVVLTLAPILAMERLHARGRLNRLERRGEDFGCRLQEAYLALCENAPERCRHVDANDDCTAVASKVWDSVREMFE